MKLHSDITINGKAYSKGDDIPWFFIYPFFGIHMLMFGGSGFLMAYAPEKTELGFLYMHGGFAIFVYVIFYLVIFGVDEVKWMFINAALGIFGIYSQIGWILARFGKDVSSYSPAVHVVPFLYFVLYTFLLRQFLLDITGAKKSGGVKKVVDSLYVSISILFYGGSYLLQTLRG